MVRRSFAIFFLIVYTLVAFKPAFPFVNYLLNKEYIAKNLCENRNKPKMNCNGKCHLMKEIKKTGSEPSPANNTSQKNTGEESVQHLGGSFTCSFSNEELAANYAAYALQFTLSSYSKGIFHPPSVLC
jgi:hypothetical protein